MNRSFPSNSTFSILLVEMSMGKSTKKVREHIKACCNHKAAVPTSYCVLVASEGKRCG